LFQQVIHDRDSLVRKREQVIDVLKQKFHDEFNDKQADFEECKRLLTITLQNMSNINGALALKIREGLVL
jgi:hypothetical protein